jgi:hypothetical protein
MEKFTSVKKEKLRRKVEELKIRKKILSTWDIIKEKDFHLNSDYLVIERREFDEILLTCMDAIRGADSEE